MVGGGIKSKTIEPDAKSVLEKGVVQAVRRPVGRSGSVMCHVAPLSIIPVRCRSYLLKYHDVIINHGTRAGGNDGSTEEHGDGTCIFLIFQK